MSIEWHYANLLPLFSRAQAWKLWQLVCCCCCLTPQGCSHSLALQLWAASVFFWTWAFVPLAIHHLCCAHPQVSFPCPSSLLKLPCMWHVGFQRALPLFQRLLGGACYLPLFQGSCVAFCLFFKGSWAFFLFLFFRGCLGWLAFCLFFRGCLGWLATCPFFKGSFVASCLFSEAPGLSFFASFSEAAFFSSSLLAFLASLSSGVSKALLICLALVVCPFPLSLPALL